MEIVLATRNKKKLAELQRILSGLDVRLHTLDDFPDCPEVEEDQPTFSGNAIKKARAIANCTNLIALSDDSGLEVEALGGAPGVYSARYAGEGANDQSNVDKLLREMQTVPAERRQARFVCVIALAYPDGRTATFEGFVAGSIGVCPMGHNGFGYDPLFYPSGHDRTFAQMTAAEKDALSHRANALAQLRAYIEKSMHIS